MSYDGPRFAFPSLSPAIKQLLLINAVVFLANILLVGRLSAPAEGGGGFWLAFSWSGLWGGYGLGLLRVITYQFTHSFSDPMHVLMNMLVLYFFGTMAESRLGYRGAWKLYLTGGVVGALLHLAIASLQGGANVPLVGASGACYSFLVYAACMAPYSSVIFIIFPIPLWVLASLLVGLGVYSTFVEFATGYAGGVSNGAHLGGALLGFVAYRANLFLDYRPYGYGPGFFGGLRQRWAARRQETAQRSAQERELQLDTILAKVKAQGLSSLTAAERRFLERTSAQKGRNS
jgi:membrane associated rhomboid family serine protease